tara:strand:+ start:515 stop:1243 length:729 start_codon:yes stop_codon:yes gene_type:complete
MSKYRINPITGKFDMGNYESEYGIPEGVPTLDENSLIETDQIDYTHAANEVQGYYGLVSNYYDPSATNVVQSLVADTWTKIVLDSFEAIRNDLVPLRCRAAAQPDGTTYGDGNGVYDIGEGRFSCAGLNPGSSVVVRVLHLATPDVDESSLSLRLRFDGNANGVATIPDTGLGAGTFVTTTNALEMSQGAAVVYPNEELISFFVGDTLDGTSWDTAGSFTVEAKSTEDLDFEALSLTFFVSL